MADPSISAKAAAGALGRTNGWGATAVYGAAHVGKSLFWYGGEVLFAYFLTDVAGLSSAVMGLVLASGLIVSAAFDLVVGVVWRARISTPAYAARLQFTGALAASAGLITFLTTPYVPATHQWLWALVAGLVFRLGFSIYDVPQNALMSLAATGTQARARVATVRIAGSGLATLAVAGLVGPLIAARNDGDAAALMMGVGIAGALLAVTSAYGLSRTVQGGAAQKVLPQQPAPLPSRRGLRALSPYLAMMAAMMIGPPLFQKLEPYFAVQVMDSAAWGGAIILAAAFGVTVGQPFWLRLSALPRTVLFGLTAALQAIGGIVFFLSPVEAPLLLAFAAFLVGLGNGGLGMAKWAAFSSAAGQLGRGLEGMAFAAFTATGKLSLALGVGLVAVVIATSDAAPEMLKMAMSVGPVAGSALMIALAFAPLGRPARPRPV